MDQIMKFKGRKLKNDLKTFDLSEWGEKRHYRTYR